MELMWFNLGRPNLDFGQVGREVFVPAGDAQIREGLGPLKDRRLRGSGLVVPACFPGVSEKKPQHYPSQPSLLQPGLFLHCNDWADIRKTPS